MRLIADGGSTKADWILLDNSGNQVFKTRTGGLNPAVFAKELLEKRIAENKELFSCKDSVDEVFFYGAGCGTQRPTQILKEVFEAFFTKAKVDVKEDTYAASYAVTVDEPCLVCILGTGSNSCYFDGKKVTAGIPSLGYVIMDEASGNYFGKKLLRDYYYKKMPSNLAKKFEEQFDLDADEIKRNIYKEENPNTYLAHFAEFIFKNERNLYFNKVLTKGMKDFFTNRVLPFEVSNKVPIRFVGSIAYFAADIIKDVAHYYLVNVDKIVRRPIDGLIDYHQKLLQGNK